MDLKNMGTNVNKIKKDYWYTFTYEGEKYIGKYAEESFLDVDKEYKVRFVDCYTYKDGEKKSNSCDTIFGKSKIENILEIKEPTNI